MHLTSCGHSCVRVEVEATVVVIDPGVWSDVPGVLDQADHVLVTHEHADHLAVDAVAGALRGGARFVVHGPRAALDTLADAGAPADRLDAVVPGNRFTLGGIEVQVGGGVHAEVHPDVPRPENLGYLVGPIWHPGDSFDHPPAPARVLLVPVAGPWLAVRDAIDLVRAVRPELAIPIHDAVLDARGRALVDGLVGRLGGAGEYRRPLPGEVLTV